MKSSGGLINIGVITKGKSRNYMVKQFPYIKVCCPFLLISTVLNCTSFSNFVIGNNREKAIRKTIHEELTVHPKATLLDLYKNFFQGKFGSGHMITDTAAASNYLKEELQSATQFDSVLWQPVGYEDSYYRVNLSLVRDGKIDMQQLIAAFTEKQNTSETSLDAWKNEWNSILKIIEEMNLSLQNFEKDRLQIAEDLRKGIVIGHHSSIYLNIYHPHYRIVTKAHFLELYKKANTK